MSGRTNSGWRAGSRCELGELTASSESHARQAFCRSSRLSQERRGDRCRGPGACRQRRGGATDRAAGSSHRADAAARDRSAGDRRGADHRQARRRLHGRRHQVARLRIRRGQPGIELPRHPRVDRQLRRQHRARVHHLLPRRILGGDGARLLQGRGQADGGAVPRHGRHAARGDGDLQRLLRPRTGLHHGGQHAGCDAAAARRGMGAQRAGRGGDGPRLHQVGRSADLAAAFRGVGGARLQDRDDAADDAGAAGRRRRPAGRSDHVRDQRAPSRAEAHAHLASARRLGCGRRGGEAPGRGAESGDRGRPRRPHTRRHRQADRAGRDAAGARRQSGRAHELPDEASAQSERECPAARRQRRRDPRPRAHRLLGHGERVARFARAHVEADREARDETDQHHRARSRHERQLPGLSALPGSGHRDGRRCRGHAAGADRGVQAAHHRRSPHRVCRSRETAGRGARARRWSVPARRPPTGGTPRRSAPLA